MLHKKIVSSLRCMIVASLLCFSHALHCMIGEQNSLHKKLCSELVQDTELLSSYFGRKMANNKTYKNNTQLQEMSVNCYRVFLPHVGSDQYSVTFADKVTYVKYHQKNGDASEGHIDGLRVHDNYQGCGIGSLLVSFAKKHLQELGVTRIELLAMPIDCPSNAEKTEELPALVAFYRKNGFRVIRGQEPHEFSIDCKMFCKLEKMSNE